MEVEVFVRACVCCMYFKGLVCWLVDLHPDLSIEAGPVQQPPRDLEDNLIAVSLFSVLKTELHLNS